MAALAITLRQTYRLRFYGLDRRVRKIVKNKFRYTLRYEMVPIPRRLIVNIAAIRLGFLTGERRFWEARLAMILGDVLADPDTSFVCQLIKQQQRLALEALDPRPFG